MGLCGTSVVLDAGRWLELAILISELVLATVALC